ncbi:sarcosine oxidase subunit alpha family protein [Paracoccus pacificus]|uniref:Sarcosine oxidase subunit alpha family protein n=1 Tax=Paracoccus pacificus TaxID=1463598 RepID=A0ABW4R5W6_9RHOB
MSGGTAQPNRLAGGGKIDRGRTLKFSFDGKTYHGHPGDTLASALIANGVRLMGRSFKYHRPRGVLTSGSEEPNALVELRSGARREPNTRAPVVELYDGLEAKSQNRWPSLGFDALAINDLGSRFLGAGFYYKTFMWPKAFWERVYEPIIRRAAGLGRLSMQPDPDRYDKGFLHCDLLIAGAGPAGLAAALTAGRAGARVILADEDFLTGGRLNAETEMLGDVAGADWAAQVTAELAAMPNVRIMTRTTVFGTFDHGIFGALERVSDHRAVPADGQPRQTLWRIYARRALVCAGALERPIAFPNNDRPGIMLAGAMRAFVNRFAAAPAMRVAIFANNDDAHRTARDLLAAGVEVAAVIDPRADAPAGDGYPVIRGKVVDTSGRLGLKSVAVETEDGGSENIACEALGVSGGWNPNLALTCHKRGRPTWDEQLSAFVPDLAGQPELGVAGAAAGRMTTAEALRSGAGVAQAALSSIGIDADLPSLPQGDDQAPRLTPLWHVPGSGKRAWVDLQNDVTTKDVALAHKENFRSVEHLKRYTTLGMATDQGKTSNVTGLAVMAGLTGQTISQTGTTIYRPPFTPVAIAALAGGSVGPDFKPRRLTPTHHWAAARNAVFTEVGNWMRAQWYPLPGETTWQESAEREARAVRSAVGLCDVTTLGKIDVQGADAGLFLDRIYANRMSNLKVGMIRYGLMLREDGHAWDDGTAARMAEDHFIVTTTTANAVPVFRHMEFCRQCLWPDLDVQLISTTEAWAQIAVAGPNARELLTRVIDPEHDISDAAFPFMACGTVSVGGTPARLFRISFSGELAYEIAVPARYGHALMQLLMDRGADLGVTPYGTEALGILRIEKGHAAGNELNGQTTALMLGLGRMVSNVKDNIGNLMTRREGMVQDHRRMVGLMPIDPKLPVPAGSHIVAEGMAVNTENDQGWVTSACRSPHLDSYIALAFVERGDARMGEVIRAVNPLQGSEVRARIVSPHFIDPEGGRVRG